MKRFFFIPLFFFLLMASVKVMAQKLPDVKGLGNQLQNTVNNATGSGVSLSNDEVVGGLREALQV